MTVAARVVLAAVGVVGLVFSAAVRGEPPVEPVRIRFESMPGCPDGRAFLARMQARTPRVRLASRGEDARTFEVVIRRDGAQYLGRFVLYEGVTAGTPRRVSAAACDDVVTALALAASLSIDPSAGMPSAVSQPPDVAPARVPGPSTGAAEESPAASGAPPATIGPAQGGVPLPSPVPPAMPPPVPPPAVLMAAAPPGGRDVAVSTSSHSNSLGVDLAFDVGAVGTGTAVPRLGAGAELRWASGASASVALNFADTQSVIAQGTARLLWVTMTLSACPLRWRLGNRVWMSPCAGFDGGALSVAGAGVPQPSTALRPWLAPEAIARLGIALAPRVSLELRGTLAVPLLRDTFYFRPSTEVYHALPLVFWAGVGLGVYFL